MCVAFLISLFKIIMDQTGSRWTQLYRSLESMIQCPVCNKRFTWPVFMCGSGHSICSTCTIGSTICIQCQAPYTKIPNFLAQNLLSQMNPIKKYLTELDDFEKKSKQFIFKTKNVHKQSSDLKNELIPEQYRCWISNECKFIGGFASILKHFNCAHALEFQEDLQASLPYSNSWEMNYIVGNSLNQALNIGGQLFIVHISINDDEELSAYIIMYTGHSLAFRHFCQIEIECDKQKLCYKKGKVLSAQSSEDVILQLKRNILPITCNKLLYDALKRINRFKCSIMIEKRNDTATDGPKGKITLNGQHTVNNSSKSFSSLNSPVAQREFYSRISDKKPEPGERKKDSARAWNSSQSIKQQLYVHRQLYPNLDAHGVMQRSPVNNSVLPLPIRPNRFNGANVPSAPDLYERPPPINPYFQQYPTTTINNVPEETQENTMVEKCVVF